MLAASRFVVVLGFPGLLATDRNAELGFFSDSMGRDSLGGRVVTGRGVMALN